MQHCIAFRLTSHHWDLGTSVLSIDHFSRWHISLLCKFIQELNFFHFHSIIMRRPENVLFLFNPIPIEPITIEATTAHENDLIFTFHVQSWGSFILTTTTPYRHHYITIATSILYNSFTFWNSSGLYTLLLVVCSSFYPIVVKTSK